jgi:hypothetical protein
VSGNIITGNLYYASNRTGNWVTAPLQTDGKTYNGVLVLDNLGKGHVLASMEAPLKLKRSLQFIHRLCLLLCEEKDLNNLTRSDSIRTTPTPSTLRQLSIAN